MQYLVIVEQHVPHDPLNDDDFVVEGRWVKAGQIETRNLRDAIKISQARMPEGYRSSVAARVYDASGKSIVLTAAVLEEIANRFRVDMTEAA